MAIRHVSIASPQMLLAEYVPATSPEDLGNPLIEALPKLPGVAELQKVFGKFPIFSPSERDHPDPIRMEAISRVGNYLEPLPAHFKIATKIGLNLRIGYRYRNPADERFRREQVRFYHEAMAGNPTPILQCGPSTAPSFALFGVSGVGKSTVIERTLSFFPQVLCHPDYQFVQIVWLKIDCPPDGSLKQLLLGILSVIDRLIGSGYRVAKRGTEIDSLKIDVGCIAHNHHLGMLIIDEIQNLLDAPGVGAKTLQNFLVSFANEVKIPLVIVGTTRAVSMLQLTFRQARRSAEKGSLVWEPLKKGSELWMFFLEGLFNYQWTREAIELTPELADTLHDLTQGIHALVVCLFQLAQVEAISSGVENLTASLFSKVASEEFTLVQKMLDAMKSGDTKLIARYEDLLTTDLPQIMSRVDVAIEAAFLKENARAKQQMATERMRAVSALMTMEFSEQEVCPLVEKFFHDHPEATSSAAVHQILSSPELSSLHGHGPGSQGLRDIVREGASQGASILESLSAAGIIKDPHKY